MKTNKSTVLLAGAALLLSMLACNIGQNPDPFVPIPPTVSQGLTETAFATESPTEAPVNNSAGACANPYMPIIAGATWSYKLTGPTPDTFTRSIIAVEAGGFTDQDVFGTGVTRQGQWQCENGNLIALNPPGGNSSNVSTDEVSVDFKTTAIDGVTLPAAINPGESWAQSITLEGTQTIGGVAYPASNQTTSTCAAIGIETITVEAGTFDAMRFDCKNVLNLSLTLQDNPMSTTLTFNVVNWYAEKVGLIKTVSTGEGLDNTVELTSYTIP
jgi:hypothetical protein